MDRVVEVERGCAASGSQCKLLEQSGAKAVAYA